MAALPHHGGGQGHAPYDKPKNPLSRERPLIES
jgi:hypothetical protein